ncbi:Retinol dehydrogenase 8 [Holothuria leucospilota]|uniref:Retinol dehydrogenase 8 n=1 Tax=Holothuria leucospilota TaxID=206669 RepID=A0A9Q1C3P6_HOLLE|nr:Retinol dehydrogenase 8 [Holothuria leucospilota]
MQDIRMPKHSSTNTMADERKIVLVTGCSYGLGCYIAKTFAADEGQRFKVWATVRSLAEKTRMEEMAGSLLNKAIYILELDLSKQDSVDAAVDHILSQDDHVDILVNNAAITLIGPLECLDFNRGRQVFEVNFFGHIRLIQLLIPRMKERRWGRILNISSLASVVSKESKELCICMIFSHQFLDDCLTDLSVQGSPFLDFYVGSKHALEGFSESIASALRPFNVWVSVIQLAGVSTEHPTNVLVHGQTEGIVFSDGVDEATGDMLKVWQGHLKEGMTGVQVQAPEEVAKIVLSVVDTERPQFRFQSSQGGNFIASTRYSDPSGESAVSSAVDIITTHNLTK